MRQSVDEIQASRIAKRLNVDLNVVGLDQWTYGMNVELEHGKRFGKKTNVTNDNLYLTGQITLAHLIEFPDYYIRLKNMEDDADKYWKEKIKPSVMSSQCDL
jgi:hypothetical protein